MDRDYYRRVRWLTAGTTPDYEWLRNITGGLRDVQRLIQHTLRNRTRERTSDETAETQ
jgi:hypothetical protein